MLKLKKWLHVILFLRIESQVITCQPPEISNTELSWYGIPAENPYVYYTSPNQQLSWNDAGKFCYSLASTNSKGGSQYS